MADANDDGDDGPPSPEDVEERYDFDDFGPADMVEMSPEEWEAAFDAESWVTGTALLDRVEQELNARVSTREVFAVIERDQTDDGERLWFCGESGTLGYYETETGEVTVLDIQCTYEIGQMVNPALVDGQIVGGAQMGMAHALYETTDPYYPEPKHKPGGFGEYSLPGPSETPNIDTEVLEMPSTTGPFGTKGIGEMSATPPIPAIVNAINDAIGVRITKVPVTPEDVLRALEEKEASSDEDDSATKQEA